MKFFIAARFVNESVGAHPTNNVELVSSGSDVTKPESHSTVDVLRLAERCATI